MEETFDFGSAFDTKAAAERGFEFQLSDMHGRPAPIWIRVLGADSDQYHSTLRAQDRKRVDKLARGRRNAIPSIEELLDDTIERLAAVTIAWRTKEGVSVKMPDGQPFPAFSKQAAKDIYTRYAEIREQVDRAVMERANFLPGSEKS